MTDEELIGFLCVDSTFRQSMEEKESKKIDEIKPNWPLRLLEIKFEYGDSEFYDLEFILDNLRKIGYGKEYLQ
jgi:hypothetical protein